MLGATDLDADAQVQAFAQRLRRQVQLFRGQHRVLQVVPALLVAVAGLLPERGGCSLAAISQYRQGTDGQVVEQGGGGIGAIACRREEQRQVVLDAGRGQPGLEVLVQRAAPGVHVEALAQDVQHAGDAGLVHRQFAPGQQVHRVDAVQRALAFRIEVADRIDLVVQQLDPQRRLGAHRIDVEQAATHGEVARVQHLRHVAVAGAFQPPFLRVQVQALAAGQVETAAGQVAQRGQALEQGLHRHHHDPAFELGQALQCGQALADDLRMRAEAVVGQGLPVRERHHRQRSVVAQQGLQVRFDLVGGVVVAGHEQ